MISDYLKKYSNYYLARYSVTKKKFEDILKKKITKDFLEKKINITQKEKYMSEINSTINFYHDIGVFNEKRLLEITLQNYIRNGYSKKKIRFKILNLKFDDELVRNFFHEKLENKDIDEQLILNYLKKNRLIEKQKKLNISEKQVFDKILKKLSYQGFDFDSSKRILKKKLL